MRFALKLTTSNKSGCQRDNSPKKQPRTVQTCYESKGSSATSPPIQGANTNWAHRPRHLPLERIRSRMFPAARYRTQDVAEEYNRIIAELWPLRVRPRQR